MFAVQNRKLLLLRKQDCGHCARE